MNKWHKEYIDYLRWRCKMNWHARYLKSNWYIDAWISGVTEDQMLYFVKEMNWMIEHNKYKP